MKRLFKLNVPAARVPFTPSQMPIASRVKLRVQRDNLASERQAVVAGRAPRCRRMRNDRDENDTARLAVIINARAPAAREPEITGQDVATA
jgi:hypothetical protein